MDNSSFIRLLENVSNLNNSYNKKGKIRLFIKDPDKERKWELFRKELVWTTCLKDNFNVYGSYDSEVIYKYNDTYYIYHSNDNPPKIVEHNWDNLYDFIRSSIRKEIPSESYLPTYYSEQIIYLVSGYKNCIYIPLKHDSDSPVIYFKFFIETNPDLYWGKDLTSFGSLDQQLRSIFGSHFEKFLYNPYLLYVSSNKSMELPDYKLYLSNHDIAKKMINIKEEPEFKYVEISDKVKPTDINFDEFYSSHIGFKCEPTNNNTESKKFFLLGIISGSLTSVLIIEIIKLLFTILL